MKRSRSKFPKATGLRRYQDWPCRLHDFIDQKRSLPFAWGKNDCCLFACDGIRALTGLDPAAEMFRGKYRDATGAARLLKKHGGVEAVAKKQCRRFGFPEVPVAMARRGDVLLVDMPGHGAALGICEGHYGVFPGPDGLEFVQTGLCRRAWRVD